MRVGSTLLLKERRCYQSYNWRCFRPMGTLQVAMDSLDEYECDEVAIIRPVREWDCLEPFCKDLDVIREMNTVTPICFGGGIRCSQHLDLLKDLPIERLIFSSAFIENNHGLVESARLLLGKQAIQCLLPIKVLSDTIHVYLSSEARFLKLDELDFVFINGLANEIILYDVENDGGHDSFNTSLVERVPIERSKLVITGGVGKSTIDWARSQRLASVLIDNKSLHKEFSIRGYKNVR